MESQKDLRQSFTFIKIIIIAVLALAVGAVFYMKQHALPEQGTTPSGVQAAAEPSIDTSESIPRLIDLGSNKCQSCLAMIPILERLTEEYDGRLEVLFIDVWKNPDEAVRYGIQLIPTQIFLDPGGNELFRHEGFFSGEDILAKWKELGFTFDG